MERRSRALFIHMIVRFDARDTIQVNSCLAHDLAVVNEGICQSAVLRSLVVSRIENVQLVNVFQGEFLGVNHKVTEDSC